MAKWVFGKNKKLALKPILGLHKSKRLKSKKSIDDLFNKKQVIFVFPFRILYALQPRAISTESAYLFACGVSKKLFKHSVKRNRIKRLLRESFRQNQPLLQQNTTQQLHIFFQYTHKQIIDFSEINKAMQQAIHNINQICTG
jgi:ribonuclease P protein component